MAEDVNAAIDDSFSNAAAWVPVALIQRKDGSVGKFFHLIDQAKPGVIAVTREGRRFTDASQNYHDFCPRHDGCPRAGRPDVLAGTAVARRYGPISSRSVSVRFATAYGLCRNLAPSGRSSSRSLS